MQAVVVEASKEIIAAAKQLKDIAEAAKGMVQIRTQRNTHLFAVAHTMRHVAETVSMSKVAASFTHIIKSSEPAFSVLDSRFLLGETFPMSVYLSLVPIIGSFALAAVTELNLNMTGLLGNMISNLAFVFRNIFSKGGMKGKSVGGMNYYACLSMLSHPLCHCRQGFPGVDCWLAKSSLPDWTQFHMNLFIKGYLPILSDNVHSLDVKVSRVKDDDIPAIASFFMGLPNLITLNITCNPKSRSFLDEEKVLNAFPFPWLTSTLSLSTGPLTMLVSWALKISEAPKINSEFWKTLFPVAVAHTIGHVAAMVSMSIVAISLTHIVKSGEPAFSVLVSRFLLGETFPVLVYLSLVPIIGGCVLAAVTELNFNMTIERGNIVMLIQLFYGGYDIKFGICVLEHILKERHEGEVCVGSWLAKSSLPDLTQFHMVGGGPECFLSPVQSSLLHVP
ncbi:hypothetical protein F0562_011083 [Nyssa sinensis]|uniref:Sugar phosphate transporter domain-containing protein n=1 Tax=Nyssa sinensis TaxID=561372 RepID=A0A5J5A2I3_9ASTE|nr:hypothetical protein F0562_011083 [Nyssa sinensis]